jgi:hypothetical protein
MLKQTDAERRDRQTERKSQRDAMNEQGDGQREQTHRDGKTE